MREFNEKEVETLKDIILYRRDVRGNRFTDQPVPQEVLDDILFAGVNAPSVGFSQPWEFVVIDDLEVKNKIKDTFVEENEKAKELFSDQKLDAYTALKLEGITESPVNIAVFYKPSDHPVLGQTSMEEAGEYSVVCAIQNMWLMARSLNVGLGWVSILDPEKVKKVLNAPEDRKLIGYLCLGYVDYFFENPELERLNWEKRKKTDEVVLKNQYLEVLNSTQHITLIGMGDHIDSMLPVGRELLMKHTHFSGGKRHYELLKPILPKDHTWIEISGKMQTLIDQYATTKESILIFTSGDPFFFGFGNTLKRLMPEAKLDIVPWFSSIQRLCHKAQINASEIKHVTLHGRSWNALDAALLNNESIIGVLTDAKHAPNFIAQRLIDFGFTNYQLIVGEHLDGEQEQIIEIDLDEASKMNFATLNAVILSKTHEVTQRTSFNDDFYRTLDNRPGMITKRPFRSLAIQALELSSKLTFWDVGACTASVAIESKRMFPSLEVTAFEIREECEEIIHENLKNTSTPGIQVEIGDFFNTELEGKQPDAVFIGGHGNQLDEIIQRIDNYLKPNGRLVMNTVSEASKETFIKTTKKLGYQLDNPLLVNINEYNAINVLAATKQKA